jgi:hypothetical protein
MPFRDFPADIIPSQNYTIAGKLLLQIFDALQQDGKLRATPPLFMQDGPGGKVLSVALPPGATLLRISSTASGAGTYNARTQQVTSNTQSSATGLNLASWYGDMQSTDDATYENIFENQNASGTHLLGADTYVYGYLTSRFDSDHSMRPIYAGDTVPDGFIPVQVTVDGGVAGSMATSTSCNLTYKLYDMFGNAIPGATGLTPDVYRVPNCAYHQPADNSPGIAYIDHTGAWHLYDAAQERIPGTTINVVTSMALDGSNNLQQTTTPLLVLDKGTANTPTTIVPACS